MLTATLDQSGSSIDVILRNLSREGALVQGDELPDEGEKVLFHRQGLSVPGRVAWSRGRIAGIEFDFPLYPRELLRHIPQPNRPAKPASPGRRPGLAAKPLSAVERAMMEQWATNSGDKLGE